MKIWVCARVLTLFRVLLLIGLLIVLAESKSANAAMVASPVRLKWDASPSAVTASYAIYYGVLGSAVTNRLYAGAALEATVAGLSASTNHFFYVVACSTAGVESTPSNVLVYNPPVLSGLKLSPQTDGTMRVQFSAAAGSVCRVEYTSSLNPAQWQSFGTATADANGNVVVNDPPGNRPATRFYRCVRL